MNDIELIVKIDADVYTRLFDNGIQDNEIATDDICEMARTLRLGTPLTDKVRESNLFLTKCSAEDITTQIDKSNFNKEQYNADLQCAYDCGKASVQPIFRNKTNGEVIQALFPNIDKCFSNIIDLNLWWNAKYKADKGDKE